MVRIVFNKMKTILKYLYEECRAVYYLQLQKAEKKESDKPIRVGFIVQMPEIWDKEAPVYEEMLNDARFAPVLIVVPPYDQKLKVVRTEYENNYFLLKYPDSIKAYADDEWYAFDEKEYDYIFFQRPYDIYLPQIYKSRNIISKAKCCYIPYGYSGADFFNKGNTKRSFFRNMSYVFAESEYMASVLKVAYKKWWFANLHNVLNLGYPALIPYFNIKPSNCFINLLWTPRWTYDLKAGGGSHFLEYKDTFLQLRHLIKSNQVNITFRPHPLMFGELVSKGLMRQDEVDIYIENLGKNGIEFDRGKPIFETFQNTDILITDFSTIIIQFFITGRPIIYCEGDIALNQVYSKLREGMYIANNEEDIIKHIKAIRTGNDYLQEKRQKIIEDLFSTSLGSTKRIVDYIAQDYRKKNGGNE